jgi:hypothetical protein
MKQLKAKAFGVVLLGLFPVLVALDSPTQIVSPLPGESTCKGSSLVIVKVTDKSGAVIADAFVLLRADGSVNQEPLQLELLTHSAGKLTGTATTSVPCGYLDVFATARGFAPYAKKFLIQQNAQDIVFFLEVYPRTDY